MKNTNSYTANPKNERLKRDYLEWYKEADGNCDSSVENTRKTIQVYEDYTKHEDFKRFSKDRAIGFKEWLRDERKYRGQPIKESTYVSYLNRLKKFFNWISKQPGYKKSVTSETVSFLSPTDKELSAADQSGSPDYPTIEEVVRLVNSITGDTEIDRRDRALLSFALLTGIRETAMATLPLGSFFEGKLYVRQEHKLGVKTKRSKLIFSLVFPFDQSLLRHISAWTAYLREKGFGNKDPLFPKAKMFQKGEGDLCYATSREVEPEFWKTGESIQGVFKKRSHVASLTYYSPHKFRHLGARLALQACRNGEHIKAVSLSFGHELVMTIMKTYGNLTPQRMLEVREEMDFSYKKNKSIGGETGFI